MKRIAFLIAALSALLPAAPAAAQTASDVITVGTVTGGGPVIDVPVYIRDVSGTPLGIDQPPGSRIQSYSIKVDYAPASAVSSVTFTRAGITSSLTPTFEVSPSSPGSISLLDTFQEATNLIPFTLNAPAPGNQVAHLLVTLSPSATPGTVITLTLDPLLTQLTNEGGTPASIERTLNGTLTLVNGSITVTGTSIPTLSPWALAALALLIGTIALRLRL